MRVSIPSLSPTNALAYPSYAFYLAARFLTTLAVQMQSVAIGWQVYEVTGDPFDLGLIGLAQFLPFFILVLPAGQIADRYNRKWILIACYALEVLCALLLLAYTISDEPTVWPVFAVLALFGTARAFAMPTSQAITPNLVPVTAFGNAVALNSSASHIATIAGPALGGLLYLSGPTVVYTTVAVVLSLSVLLMEFVQLPAIARSREPATWHTVLEGLRFVRGRPVILGAMSLDLFAVLFGGAVAMLPAYASDVLEIGSTGLGWLRSAPAAGAALTAIALGIWPIRRHVGSWMFGGVAVFACAIVTFGVSTSFWLSLIALTIMGAGDMVSVFIRHLLIQLETPDEIRGRVSAVNAVFIGASNELGEFESGLTARWFGLVPSVIVGGVMTLSVTGLCARWFPALRTIDTFPGQARMDGGQST